jgi:hypothetical protein
LRQNISNIANPYPKSTPDPFPSPSRPPMPRRSRFSTAGYVFHVLK